MRKTLIEIGEKEVELLRMKKEVILA